MGRDVTFSDTGEETVLRYKVTSKVDLPSRSNPELNYEPHPSLEVISLNFDWGMSFDWASVFPIFVMEEEWDFIISRFSSGSIILWLGLREARWESQDRKNGWLLPLGSIWFSLPTAGDSSLSRSCLNCCSGPLRSSLPYGGPTPDSTTQLKVPAGAPPVSEPELSEDTPLRIWPLPGSLDL